MSAYIISKHLTNIINNDLLRNSFLDSAKIASVKSIFKKGERTEIGNYEPVSTLNCFSKIYGRFLHNQIASFSNEFLSDFISASKKGYSANHILIRLIENWRKLYSTRLTHAYRLSFDTVTFLNSYLKVWKQNIS